MSLQDKAQSLAKRTEEKLSAAQWRSIISVYQEEETSSKWALALVGAFLAVLVQNAKDLLEIIDLLPFKAALILLLLSGVLGLRALSGFKKVALDVGGKSKLGADSIEILNEHQKQFSAIEDDAKKAGEAISDPLDFGAFLEPIEKHSPTAVRRAARELEEREKNPDRRWTTTRDSAKKYSDITLLQIMALVAAIVVLLIFLKEPNKALETTPVAVTSAAWHPPRQPQARLT